MGNIDSCNMNPQLHYISTSIGIGEVPTPIFLGLCLPKDCLEEVPFITKLLTEMIQE